MIRSASWQANTSSTARTTMLRNGLPAGQLQAAVSRRLLGRSRAAVSKFRLKRASGPTRYEPPSAQQRMQGVGVLHVLLDEVLFVFGDIDIQAPVRDQAAFVERIFVGMGERHKLVVLLEIGKLEPGDQLRGGQRGIQRPLQILRQRAQFGSLVGTL